MHNEMQHTVPFQVCWLVPKLALTGTMGCRCKEIHCTMNTVNLTPHALHNKGQVTDGCLYSLDWTTGLLHGPDYWTLISSTSFLTRFGMLVALFLCIQL